MLHVKQSKEICTKCREKPRADGQRYCPDCRAAYNREWRKADKAALESVDVKKQMGRLRRRVLKAAT